MDNLCEISCGAGCKGVGIVAVLVAVFLDQYIEYDLEVFDSLADTVLVLARFLDGIGEVNPADGGIRPAVHEQKRRPDELVLRERGRLRDCVQQLFQLLPKP